MPSLKVNILGILILCTALQAQAQLGGSSTYSFLGLTNSARVASLGGKTVGAWDNDLNIPFHNPSLLNDSMSDHIVVNYVNYFSDINYGYISYARHVDKVGNVAGGLHYINYGSFTAADQEGNITGEFRAAEYALNLIWSRPIDSLFHVGVNLKPVYSVLESYHSVGLVADAAVSFVNRKGLFTASLVLRNFGSQIKTYHDGNREPMPFEILLGMTQKLEHAPFRFYIVAQNLQRLDLTWKDAEGGSNETDPITGAIIEVNRLEVFGDKFMRHMIFGVEVVPIDHFFLRAGYNYQRRQELKISTNVAMVGFSWGFGLKISRFQLSYGRASYHLAGASNHFSISSDLSRFLPSL